MPYVTCPNCKKIWLWKPPDASPYVMQAYEEEIITRIKQGEMMTACCDECKGMTPCHT